MPIEAHALNTFVKRLIGVPFVHILDEHVSATMEGLIANPDINQMLAALVQIDLLSVPVPLWGELDAGDISFLRIVATGDS